MKELERPKEKEGQTKPRKQHKMCACQRCGHSPLKDYGHSQLNLLRGKVSYCALQDGISVDLWQARQRSRETEETKKEQREGRLPGAGATGGREFKEEDTE
ncbi:unnamed protein product [Pleuronectes platessa]|uniref:Uncharacterized protein n=1 Tax=Pleuronectes platessa TaxID=8262 RepID=A0A9N7UU71_PLEPL|nr:unnamed protein product [Pleuronectes platessa]